MAKKLTKSKESLASYKTKVNLKLDALMESFSKIAIGNFDEVIQIPDDDDEFSVLFAGVKALKEMVEEKINQLEDLNQQLGKKVSHKSMALEEVQAMAHIGTWERDLITNKMYWSDELYLIAGLALRSLMDLDKFISIVHPDDRNYLLKSLKEVIESQEQLNVYYRIIRPDGSIRTLFGRGTVEYDSNNNPRRIYGITQDVTELKETENALIESEKLHRAVIESMSEGLIIADNDDHILMVNKALLEITGYKESDLIGKVAFRILTTNEQEAGKMKSRLKKRTGGVSETYVSQLRTKDGGQIWVRVNASPYKNKAGEIIGTIGALSDITTEIEAEELFRNLLESAPDAMVIVDEKGVIKLVNVRTERLFGYERKDIIEKGIEILMPKRYRANHHNYIREYFTNPKFRVLGSGLEVSGETKTGEEFPIEISLSPIETKSGTIVTAAIRDVSDRKKVQMQIEESLREKEILLQEIHHRVKNNLQVISSLFNLAASNSADEQVQNVLLESKHRVESMALVHRMLYQSKNLSNIPFREYASELISAIIDNSNLTKQKEISFQVKSEKIQFGIDTAIPLGLIINELVSNSCKYAFCNKSFGKISLDVTNSDQGYSLMFKDNGTGLPVGFNLKDLNSLGLELVDALTAQLDGKLSYGNNKGAFFKIEFKEQMSKNSYKSHL